VANGIAPVVAYNQKNNSYLIAYQRYIGSDYDIYARRVDYAGPTNPEFPVAFNLNDDETVPAIAYNTNPSQDEFLIVWENMVTQTTTTYQVEAQLVAGTAGGGDGGGETIGSRLFVAVSSGVDREPDVAYNLNMNEYLVVYTREGPSLDVYGRRITRDGILQDEEVIDSSGGDQYNPSVAAYRLNMLTPYLVVFTDTWNDTAGDVRGYLVSQDGEPIQLINIATMPGQREFNPAIAHSEAWGGYFVTWTQGPISDTDIFGMRVSDSGLINPEFDISSPGSTPIVCDRTESDIAVGEVSALAVWSDDCGNAGGLDILGRLLGYRVYLPLIIR
jgi:hypothetical protein